MEDFERWLIDEVGTQTLTDELKAEIIERVEALYQDAHGEGYHDAREIMYNCLEGM